MWETFLYSKNFHLYLGIAILVISLIILKKLKKTTLNLIGTWEMKPFNSPLSFEEKRALILRKNKPRIQYRYNSVSVNEEDSHFHSLLDRYTISLMLGAQQAGQSFNFGGEMAQATPDVIASSRQAAPRIRERVLTEFNIDLELLARGDVAGADLLAQLENQR